MKCVSVNTPYTRTSGRLTFAANQVVGTVTVPVLDDSHDEGSETLTLTLSAPRPSRVKLADAVATGTITNDDPMPRAWIARFGRTVAEQVLDAVEGRMRAGRRPGAEVRLAGERIGLRPLFAPGSRYGDRDRSGSGAGAGSGAVASARDDGDAEAPGSGSGAGARAAADVAAWLKGGPDAERAGLAARTRTMDAGDLLLGSSFGATAKAGEGFVSVWGRGAVTRFDGREGALTLDGEVTSAMLGTDFSRGRWTAGLLVSRSLGEGGYREGSDRGTVEATLTGLYPWARHALGDRLEIWGAAGYGEGTLALRHGAERAMRTDLDLRMAAAGLRGALLDPGSGSGAGPGSGSGASGAMSLTAKADAMIVQTSTEAVSGRSTGNLAAAEAEVTRLRFAVEAARPLALGPGSTLTPSLEVGARHDGGDAETGFGLDLGGGLALADPGRGISAELRGRGLLSHKAKGFRERGLSGSLTWRPGTAGHGPRLSLTQTLGGSSAGGADALFGRGALDGLAAGGNELRRRRLEARFGYGLPAFGNRFTLTPEAAAGFSDAGREYSLGWRLERGGAFALSSELRRREHPDPTARPEHEIAIRFHARF